MTKKLKAWECDYQFYKRHMNKFNFCGSADDETKFKEDANGINAKQAFKWLDSNGIIMPCREVSLLRSVMRCKASINFHIKMWVEGFYDMCQPIEDYLHSFDNPPDWVRISFENQKRKYWYNRLKE